MSIKKSKPFEKKYDLTPGDSDYIMDPDYDKSYEADAEADLQAAEKSASFQKEFKAVFEDDAPENKNRKKFGVVDSEGAVAGTYDWIRCVIFSVAIVVCVLTFVFRLVEVDGKSMNDTLANQDKVIVTDLFYTPHNNDIVVIAHAENYGKPIIKRVIAVGGQTVKLDFENDKLYVDGIELNEPYIKGSTFSGNEGDKYLPLNDDGSFVVPENKVFVMGDNRYVSLDSRSEKIGLIDRNDIIGKAQFVVFPFDHFGNVYDK